MRSSLLFIGGHAPANADDGHHAAGVAVRGAMGEEEIGVALRAAADDLNGFAA